MHAEICRCVLLSLRWRWHYGENDGYSDVTFRCSHFPFCTVSVTVSLPCRERRRGNACHGDGDDSQRCYFGCVRAKKWVMVSKGKKPRVKWDSKVKRKLIGIWADIIEEFHGKLITRKKKETIATTQLNVYISQQSWAVDWEGNLQQDWHHNEEGKEYVR